MRNLTLIFRALTYGILVAVLAYFVLSWSTNATVAPPAQDAPVEAPVSLPADVQAIVDANPQLLTCEDHGGFIGSYDDMLTCENADGIAGVSFAVAR